MKISIVRWSGLVCVLAASCLIHLGSARAEGGKEVVGFPGSGAEVIYSALDVPETDVSQGLGISILQKSVGGLVCQKSTVIAPGAVAKYECELSDSSRDDAAIYEALSVQEENLVPPHIVGISRVGKTAGPLVCTKSHPVVPNPVYDYRCELK